MLGKGTHLEKSDQERSRKGGWRAEWMKKISVGCGLDSSRNGSQKNENS